jgi:hypothetical protein
MTFTESRIQKLCTLCTTIFKFSSTLTGTNSKHPKPDYFLLLRVPFQAFTVFKELTCSSVTWTIRYKKEQISFFLGVLRFSQLWNWGFCLLGCDAALPCTSSLRFRRNTGTSYPATHHQIPEEKIVHYFYLWNQNHYQCVQYTSGKESNTAVLESHLHQYCQSNDMLYYWQINGRIKKFLELTQNL